MDEELVAFLKEKYKDRKICIAWPSPEKTDYRFNHDMIQLITQNGLYLKIGIANEVSSRIALNRNKLVQDARNQNATDILFIDADTKFPINGLLRLLSHDKDIVGATTARRFGTGDLRPIGTPVFEGVGEAGQVLFPMKLLGMPFMLVKMSVFDRLDEKFVEWSGGIAQKGAIPYFAEPPRWMTPEIASKEEPFLVGEDEYFCFYARKAGFEVLCDEELSMLIGHVGSQVYYIQPEKGRMEAKARSAKVEERL